MKKLRILSYLHDLSCKKRTVLQISILAKMYRNEWVHSVRSLAMLKVHRNLSSSLEAMQSLSLLNDIMPSEQKDRWSPNQLTSCPFLTLIQRKADGALTFRAGRNGVEWSNIPNYTCVLQTFFRVKVALSS